MREVSDTEKATAQATQFANQLRVAFEKAIRRAHWPASHNDQFPSVPEFADGNMPATGGPPCRAAIRVKRRILPPSFSSCLTRYIQA